MLWGQRGTMADPTPPPNPPPDGLRDPPPRRPRRLPYDSGTPTAVRVLWVVLALTVAVIIGGAVLSLLE